MIRKICDRCGATGAVWTIQDPVEVTFSHSLDLCQACWIDYKNLVRPWLNNIDFSSPQYVSTGAVTVVGA